MENKGDDEYCQIQEQKCRENAQCFSQIIFNIRKRAGKDHLHGIVFSVTFEKFGSDKCDNNSLEDIEEFEAV